MNFDATFLDTGGWMALLNAGDRLHASAASAWREVILRRKFVVMTDWIVAETGNGLARSRYRGLFVESLRLLSESPEFRIFPVSDGLLKEAIDLYRSRDDKMWGLVDCASFVLMAREGIREAITPDRHFEQAGFRCLLR